MRVAQRREALLKRIEVIHSEGDYHSALMSLPSLGPAISNTWKRDHCAESAGFEQALWDSAGWRAVSYFFAPKVMAYPALGLGFRDRDAAEKIFQAWQKQLGPNNEGCKLRVTILKDSAR